MPYETKDDLPDGVHDNLPDHAQDIYIAAYNNAWDHYKDPEDRQGDASREEKTARRIAWAAVKDYYRKTESGWVKKQD